MALFSFVWIQGVKLRKNKEDDSPKFDFYSIFLRVSYCYEISHVPAAVERIAREDYQGVAIQNRQPISRSSYDPTLQIDSMVQVSVNGLPCYGLIKWIGSIEEMSSSGELIAGLELVRYEF